MKGFVDTDHGRLDEVEGVVCLREVIFPKEHKIDRTVDGGHKIIKKVEVGAFQSGLEDTIKHDNDDELDNDVDDLGKNCSGALTHDLFGFSRFSHRIVGILFLDLMDLECNFILIFVRLGTGQVNGEQDETDSDSKKDDSNTHVRFRHHLPY